MLEVHGLSYKALLKDVNFTAYGGEVLGIGGLVGSGRTELLKCIYGCLKQDSGTVTLNGVPVSKSVGKNLRNGFAYVPEDRRSEGFIPTLSIERNLALASYDRLAPRGLVLKKREAEWAVNAIKNYDIRPPMKELPVANLSGGNQQKVVVARGLARSPKVLLLDEPTAGIDVGVKAELYQIIRDPRRIRYDRRHGLLGPSGASSRLRPYPCHVQRSVFRGIHPRKVTQNANSAGGFGRTHRGGQSVMTTQKKSFRQIVGSNWGQKISILIIFVVFMAIFQRQFFLPANWTSILRAISIYGIMACGMFFVVLIGG